MILALTLVLGLIAALHAAWGLQKWVPIADEARLARTVVGAKDIDRMPGKVPCMLVAGGLTMIILAIWVPQFMLARLILWAATLIFLGRGAIAYTAFWHNLTPEEPFHTYDQRYYAPLCIVIGVGLFITLVRG